MRSSVPESPLHSCQRVACYNFRSAVKLPVLNPAASLLQDLVTETGTLVLAFGIKFSHMKA